MRQALRLAARGRGTTRPNPMVGALVVRRGRVVATGYHHRAGESHAEALALAAAGAAARGGTLYVTLEPCAHHGRTPPCADAVAAAGVARVVAAMADPNPLVNGRGFKRLRGAGITVDVGMREAEARRLNEAYVKFITARRPFVILKMAMSLDGKIATQSGESRWITGEESRRAVDRLRAECDAVMIGVGTALRDNPGLTVRSGRGAIATCTAAPLRIVADSRARTPVESKLLSLPGRALIVTGDRAPAARRRRLEQAGAEVLSLPGDRVDLAALMAALGERGITSVLLEGGGELAAGALAAKIVDKVVFFIAPKIIGGDGAPGPVRGAGIERLADAWQLREVTMRRSGPDIRIEGYL
jgi:diaminohydroxyphosphoribosylaminopyrimidine deaminase/5-amino-6-(5-phosphoribosylamino)uracil reductase